MPTSRWRLGLCPMQTQQGEAGELYVTYTYIITTSSCTHVERRFGARIFVLAV